MGSELWLRLSDEQFMIVVDVFCKPFSRCEATDSDFFLHRYLFNRLCGCEEIGEEQEEDC